MKKILISMGIIFIITLTYCILVNKEKVYTSSEASRAMFGDSIYNKYNVKYNKNDDDYFWTLYMTMTW